jgi:NAD(P)-dependent dehydrogenase (short-subunit alcohol dehydrogenase family)
MRAVGMVRFIGPIFVAKHAAKYLTGGPLSSITLTTGSGGEKPNADWSAVAGYLGGLQALTRNLAVDLKPIRVNLISPGGVDTELWDGFPEEKRKELFERLAKSTATGAIGKVEDVAEAYLYAMRDKNLTGSVISTNGGHLLM